MIERGNWYLPGPPMMVSIERSVLPCGCFVVVGIRLDDREPAITGGPCTPAHAPIIDRFDTAIKADLDGNPANGDRQLIDVVDGLLTAAEREGV